MLLFIFIQLIEYAGSPDKLGIWGDWVCCYNIGKLRNKLTKRLNFFHFSLKTKIIFFLQSFVSLEEIYKKNMYGRGWSGKKV